MAWRLVEIDENKATDIDLTNSELIGVSVMLTHNSEPDDVYWRARQKMQTQVEKAITNDE